MSRFFWPAFLFLLAVIFAFHPVQNVDFWWHLSSARWIMDNYALPTTDPFTFTAIQTPWIYNGWLGSLVIYLAFCALGAFGIVLLQLTIVFAILWLVFKTCTDSNTESYFWLVILLFLGVYSISSGFFVRPHVFSILCFALLIYLLKNDARLGLRITLYVPVLFTFWVNLHAGALLGVATLFLFYSGTIIDRGFVLPKAEWRRITFVLLLASLAIFINPYGYELALLPIRHALDPVISGSLQEWSSVFAYQLRSYLPLVLFLVFVLIAALNFTLNFKKLGFAWLFVSLFVLAIAFRHVRFIPFFVLLQIPLIFRGFEEKVFRSKVVPATAVLLVAFLLSITVYQYGLLVTTSGDRLYPEWNIYNSEITPVLATELVKSLGPPRFFNDMVFGGYLIWELWPNSKAFIDGRVELYDPEFYRTYDRSGQDPSAIMELCDKYNLDYAILSTNRLAAGQRPPLSWKSIYKDGHATIFVRTR